MGMAMFVQLLGDEATCRDTPWDRGPRCRNESLNQLGRQLTFPVKRHTAEEAIPMKQRGHGHSAFRIEAREAEILIDPFLSDNPSRDNGWSGYLTFNNSTQGGDR